MKKYKAATPTETVERIKNILFNTHIPVKDLTYGDGDMFCSYRLVISESDDCSIGTNGKGLTPAYAQASAYAEMMERLQNRVIIYPNPAKYNFEHAFFPDETKRKLNTEDAAKMIMHYTPRAYPKNGITVENFDCIFLPFYHVNSKCTEEIPYSLIRWINGSNGMCAGNILEEALIQGFNEIFERYCLQELYLKKLTPPDIPKSTFEGTDILSNLERMKSEYGMDYQIKDCSLGKGFPVVGLLIYNQDKSKYILHLGADLSPKIALERCFTETFQGHTPKTLSFENEINSCESLDLFNEFKRSLVYGRGRMHDTFFYDQPTYPYIKESVISEGADFKEDLSNILTWLIDSGYNIFIRNNSFLGFPTYHICIPSLSDIDKEFCNINAKIKEMRQTEEVINPLYRLPLLNEKELKISIELLESMKKDVINLFPHNGNKKNSVNRLLILMLLYYRIGDDVSTSKCLDTYIKQKEEKMQPVNGYYYAIQALLQGKPMPDNPSDEWIVAKGFLNNRQQALMTCALPTCFQCETCLTKEGCRYPFLLYIEKKIQTAMAENKIQQSDLFKLIN